MGKVLSVAVPGLAKVAQVGESEVGGGLGLFASQAFRSGDIVYSWSVDSETVMQPVGALADKLESEDFGALAFQILKTSRTKDPSPWRLWWATGVESPATHPLKLVLSDPDLAQTLWSSTTCGGRMSASALRLRDDLELLKGGASLEEWAEAVALVMSRCVVEAEDGMPLLVLGLDLLQDGDDPNVQARVVYKAEGSGPLGLGDNGERRLTEVVLVATRDIEAGDELTGQYVDKPHAGLYMERYGFVPQRLLGELAPGCVELSFAPTDDQDINYGIKESLLENIGLTPDPILFYYTSNEALLAPADDNDTDWLKKSTLDKMVHILRLRHTGGADSYLLDSVYVEDLWYNCNFRLSKDNESQVCRAVIDECNRWLNRFRLADSEQEGEPPALVGIAAAAASVRRAEGEVLQRLRDLFAQELRDTMVDEARKYWADRQMDTLFPQRRGRRGGSKGRTGVQFIDDP